ERRPCARAQAELGDLPLDPDGAETVDPVGDLVRDHPDRPRLFGAAGGPRRSGGHVVRGATRPVGTPRSWPLDPRPRPGAPAG
ncbi:hypothetical protein KC217_23220, partial [Mycobacterium tuberculosis]|nr:hypothetical protein [Mycobacterium tuberculosis]